MEIFPFATETTSLLNQTLQERHDTQKIVNKNLSEYEKKLQLQPKSQSTVVLENMNESCYCTDAQIHTVGVQSSFKCVMVNV